MQSKLEPPYAIIVSHPRSGTHLLEGCLASHPKIHKRSEFVLRYKQLNGKKILPAAMRNRYIFTNHAGRVNIAIVMYAELSLFEQLCGPLNDFKVIHLLRKPADVARSCAQWQANKTKYGKKARAHFKVNETPLPNAKFPVAALPAQARKVKKLQDQHTALLAQHPATLTVYYEEFTGNREVDQLPEAFSQKLLKFIGLRHYPMVCDLRKTSS